MTDSKTATERLREMLDARGVKWWEGWNKSQTVFDGANDVRYMADCMLGQLYIRSVLPITPEQAVAATLGNGTCEMEYIDTYEYPDGEEDYLCKCSNCGRESWEPAHNLPKFCGGCGKAVKR